MVRSLDGLSEYDVRRPLVPSGTNLLGLVKHLTGIELGYLGACVGRPSPVPLPWEDDGSVWESADMWATAEQSRDYLLGLYRRAWQHSDESLRRARPRRAGVRGVVARGTARDHVRPSGGAGGRRDRAARRPLRHRARADRRALGQAMHGDVGDDAWWTAYVGRIQAAADVHRDR